MYEGMGSPFRIQGSYPAESYDGVFSALPEFGKEMSKIRKGSVESDVHTFDIASTSCVSRRRRFRFFGFEVPSNCRQGSGETSAE